MRIESLPQKRISFSAKLPTWRMLGGNDNGVQLFNSIPIKHDIFGPLALRINSEGYTGRDFKIILLNAFKKVLGYEEIRILPEQKLMMGKYIEVNPEYRKGSRKHGHKFGEVLRLSSIMTMLKNNLDSINIYSKESAVYFHSKYKFEPDMSDYFERNKSLQTIMNDRSRGFEELAQAASRLYSQARSLRGNSYASSIITQEANLLVKKYIHKAMQEKNPYLKHPLHCGLDMKLTKDTVIQNREFFNQLFKKHGIDFQI